MYGQSLAGTLSNLGLILKLIFIFAEVSILSIAIKLIKKETDKTYLGMSVSDILFIFFLEQEKTCRLFEELYVAHLKDAPSMPDLNQ